MIEYLRICRIDHWLKNVFIVFGHAVAAVLVIGLDNLTARDFALAALSLIPACLVASANYIINEILDAPFDRLHPTKRTRGVAAGKVSVPALWVLMLALVAGGFAMAAAWFNAGYVVSLALLLASGIVYNVPPVRLKDRAYLDVIAESFNNPIRLGLGYYALVDATHIPPLSIVAAWWFFGALLMTGKRYSEFRLIGDHQLSGRYRKSFQVYSERRLIIAMISYSCLFCFCTGVAMVSRPQLNNLVFVFPVIVLAIAAYFNHAMSEVGARLEPEQLLQNRWIIVFTALTIGLSVWLLTTDLPLLEWTGFLHDITL